MPSGALTYGGGYYRTAQQIGRHMSRNASQYVNVAKKGYELYKQHNKKRKFSEDNDPSSYKDPSSHKGMKYTNVVDGQSHRASMKVTGSKNVKGIRGKHHKVRV